MSGVVDKFDQVQQQIKEVKERKAAGIPAIPRRPLTAYNIFSILERHYLLQQHNKTVDPAETVDALDETSDGSTELEDPYVSTRPAKYRDVKLPPNWYVVGMNRKKRAEHKCHGVIGFKALSKLTVDAWNETSIEIKAYCKMISKEELRKYYQEQKDFKAKYGEEAFDAQKKTYNKRPKENGLGSDGKKARKKRKNAEAVEAGLSQGRKCHKKEREKAAVAAAAKAKSESANEARGTDEEGAKKPSSRTCHKKQREKVTTAAAKVKRSRKVRQEAKSDSESDIDEGNKKKSDTKLKSDGEVRETQGAQANVMETAGTGSSRKPTRLSQDNMAGLMSGAHADLTRGAQGAQSRLFEGQLPGSLAQDIHAPILYSSLGLHNGNLQGFQSDLMRGAFANSMGGASSLLRFGGNGGFPGLLGDPLLGFSGRNIRRSQLGLTGLGLDGALSSFMGGGYALALRSRLLEDELIERALTERALRERALAQHLQAEVHSLALAASVEAQRELAQYLALAGVPSSDAAAGSFHEAQASIPGASVGSAAAAGSQASTPDARVTLAQE